MPHLRGVGALAEYIVVSKESVVRKPDHVNMEEAARLGIAGCTAVPLVKGARVKMGDIVLVDGASGGVGTLIIQLAKRTLGESGKVVAVCSGKNAEFVKGLGVNEVCIFKTTRTECVVMRK